MIIKSFTDCEQKRMEKLKNLQLPHSYKKIGFGIFIFSFIAFLIVVFTFNSLEAKIITKYGILLGLLITSISKEKIEDELIIELRMQSYTFAFVIGVIYALGMPFFDYLFDFIFQNDKAIFKDMGDFQILWMLLFVQVFYFAKLKRSHNEK